MPPQPKKGSLKKTSIKKNTSTSKENISTKSTKGTVMYNADKKGNVSTSMMDNNKNIKWTTSMDTTGYAAGKPYFKHIISKDNGMNTAKVLRKDVMTRIKNMKQEARGFKKGGLVKIKKNHGKN